MLDLLMHKTISIDLKIRTKNIRKYFHKKYCIKNEHDPLQLFLNFYETGWTFCCKGTIDLFKKKIVQGFNYRCNGNSLKGTCFEIIDYGGV